MKQYKQILDRIITYANENRSEKLPEAMMSLSAYSTLHGVDFIPNRKLNEPLTLDPYMDVGQLELLKSLAIQKSLRETLESMVQGEKTDIRINGKVTPMVDKTGAVRLQLRVSDEDGDDSIVASIMIHLMLLSGIKAVKKCCWCSKYILIEKSMRQRFCGNNCRQRAYQGGLTEEQKHEQAIWYLAVKRKKKKEG